MPREIDGYFIYTVPCGGTLTSVKARGFCIREDNVELRLIYGYYDMGQLHFSYWVNYISIMNWSKQNAMFPQV